VKEIGLFLIWSTVEVFALTEENNVNINQESQCIGRDSNRPSYEYYSKALSIEPIRFGPEHVGIVWRIILKMTLKERVKDMDWPYLA
jgi:hypothetical protein